MSLVAETEKQYGAATRKKIQDLQRTSEILVVNCLVPDEQGHEVEGARVTIGSGEDVIILNIPSKSEKSKSLFSRVRLDVDRTLVLKRDVCCRLGISSTALANFLNSRGLPRDSLLSLLLLRNTPPSGDEVNHILMELGLPSFVLNRDLQDSRRNVLLYEAFNTAASRPDSGIDWLSLVQKALDRMGLERTVGRNAVISDPDIPACEEQIEKWVEAAAKAEACHPAILRRQLMDRYCEKNGRSQNGVLVKLKYAEAYRMIAQETQRRFDRRIDELYLQSLFRTREDKGFKPGGRDSIIYTFGAMGCSLEQINTLLAECNYAYLYPESVFYDDAKYIAALSKGGL